MVAISIGLQDGGEGTQRSASEGGFHSFIRTGRFCGTTFHSRMDPELEMGLAQLTLFWGGRPHFPTPEVRKSPSS